MGGNTDMDDRPHWDILIAGGEVMDPAAGLLGRLDVAIAGGRIAQVAADLDPALAANVIAARGQIVTPGLVDLHTHAYWGAT
jgi:dihydroorotase